MSSLDEIKATFFVECQELLEEMEAGLIEMSEGSHDAETVNAVFRAAHSIKGGAGAFAFDDLVSFAHRFETTLDEVRNGSLEPSAEVMAVFLRAADRLADLVNAAESGTQPDRSESDTLLQELASLIGTAPPSEDNAPEQDDGGFEPMALDFGALDSPTEDEALTAQSDGEGHEISFRPHASLIDRGSEPALLLRALADLGDTDVVLDHEAIDGLEADPSDVTLAWAVTLYSDCDQESVEEVFEFAEDDCDLEINPLSQSTTTPDPELVGQEAPEVSPQSETMGPEPEDSKKNDHTSSSTEVTSLPPETEQKVPKQEQRVKPAGSIRVDLERIDRLINLVGELVVNQAMLSQSVVDAGLVASSAVATGLDEFKNLTREVQDSVMAIRAQPIRSLFQRMSRIVREAASATGKTVRLKTEGDATEIDKTVIDMLADPLTHMIRNAVDHGLETPECRTKSKKNAEGTVILTAAHRSGRVVIEISDDGAGINRERVLAIATDKGLVSQDANLTPSEIDNLLFLPGFSTATEVSNLSGRGVGMDVVKQAIQRLGGRISIHSEPGHGSTFSISLPLTLAVLDGMLVSVDNQTLVVPLTSVIETLRPTPSNVHPLGRNEKVIKVRDTYVPIIDVGTALGLSDGQKHNERCVYLLIDGEQSGPRALAVDTILDQRQVVIKSLEDNYGHVDGVAAATILGNGRIALILDTEALLPIAASEVAA